MSALPNAPSPLVSTADGWLVCLACGDRKDYYHTREWSDALDTYDEPPRGWRAVAIVPALDGVPFGGKLAYHTIQEMRRDM